MKSVRTIRSRSWLLGGSHFGSGRLFSAALGFSCALSGFGGAARAQQVLPVPAAATPLAVGRTAADSHTPAWPRSPAAPAGAPNVLLILTDDVGFGASSAFGGPIKTPTLEFLARRGLRYTGYNNTAICSSTRAALLTGRDEHHVNMGIVTNTPTGFEGYTTSIPNSAGTVAEILKQRGYSTYAIGKWHLTPEWEASQAGPFDHWPTGMGFEHYYGFLGADDDQWSPALVEGTTFIEPPHDDPTYILDRDLADHAIKQLREQHSLAPDKPFFMYYATGSTHAPHHAPREWIDKFKGQFDQGWDKVREETFAREKSMGIIPANADLTARPKFIPAWSSLSANQRKVFSRLMEAYAGQLAYADAQLGRVVQSLQETGQLDNTIVIFIEGDNGASAEGGKNGRLFEQSFINQYDEPSDLLMQHLDEIGGPNAYNNYPTGWGWAMNAPFQYYKQTASHFGGLRDGMIISWPARIKDEGGIRPQFHYVDDVVPTILEATKIEAPAILNGVPQMPMDGISMAYTFDRPGVASRRRTQVFETMQNLGIYHDGWWAGTTPTNAPWDFTKAVGGSDPDKRNWELYHIDADYSQAHDLARKNPIKLREMQEMFWAEAAKNNVLPIHSSSEGAAGRPSYSAGRTHFTYYDGIERVPENVAPHTIGHSFTLTADVTLAVQQNSGVMISHGGRFGGYSFYLKDGRPTFRYNAIGPRQYTIQGTAPLAPGQHRLVASFAADQAKPGTAGTVTISVDGQQVAQGRVEHTLVAWISMAEGLDVGKDSLTPVSEDYTVSTSRFQGTIHQVDVDVK